MYLTLTVNWIMYPTLFIWMEICLGIFCPILMMAGLTLLGIAVVYMTAGQIDGKVLISYLLPIVKIVSATTVNMKPRKNMRFWTFLNGGCIKISEPCGTTSQLRHYLDTNPATWVLASIIVTSVLIATMYFVLYGLIVSNASPLTIDDCNEYNWICYRGKTIIRDEISCTEASTPANTTNAICYRFISLRETDNVGSGLAGAAAIYYLAIHIIPYMVYVILLLERLKKTKLWSLPILILGAICGILSVLSLVIFRFSISLLQLLLLSICLMAVGVLVGFSDTKVILEEPEVRKSIITAIDSKNTFKLQEMLRVHE